MYSELYGDWCMVTAHARRAARGGGGARLSIPFFFEPNYDAIIEPLPQYGAAGAQAARAVVYGDHLHAKLSTNFG